MKRWLLVLALLFVARQAWADVTVQITGTAIEPVSGELAVHATMQVDGVTVTPPNGQPDWSIRYSVVTLAGLDSGHITTLVTQGFQSLAATVLKQQYLKVANKTLDLSFLVGKTVTVTTAPLLVDVGNTGALNTQWTVTSTGTRTEAPYTPVVTTTP